MTPMDLPVPLQGWMDSKLSIAGGHWGFWALQPTQKFQQVPQYWKKIRQILQYLTPSQKSVMPKPLLSMLSANNIEVTIKDLLMNVQLDNFQFHLASEIIGNWKRFGKRWQTRRIIFDTIENVKNRIPQVRRMLQ